MLVLLISIVVGLIQLHKFGYRNVFAKVNWSSYDECDDK